MQVGEPVAVAPPASPPPETELAAELLAVTFKSTEKTSHAKATVVGPHWAQGQEAEIEDDWREMAKKLALPAEPYSKRAAVYLVKGAPGARYEVEVKLKITRSKNVSGDAKLTGNFKGLTIEGSCPTAAGEHTITAVISEPPEGIQCYRGKIAWRLTSDSAGLSATLGTTLAELYFILGTPTAPYARKGVWSEALRFLCGRVGVTGQRSGNDVASRVTSYCHSVHGLRYDADRGSSFYGVNQLGGFFKLKDYLLRKQALCNCYDQAAAVQALSGTVGVFLVWAFLRPFGFIKPANLVGVGLCNNPFFKLDETKKMVAADYPKRTAFGNHAFVIAGINVLDACAGPHRGTESPDQYLAASIDDTPSLYRGTFRPGRASDIVLGGGVRGVG